MKKRSIIIVFSIVVITIAGILFFKIKDTSKLTAKNLPSAKISVYFNNSDELINGSEVILICTPTNTQKNITYSDVNFVETTVKVVDVLKGAEIAKGQEITLLQTKVQEEPIISQNQKTLVFLQKYNGPVIKNAYVAVGMGQGIYKLQNSSNKSLTSLEEANNEKIKPLSSISESLNSEMEQYTVKNLIDKIKK